MKRSLIAAVLLSVAAYAPAQIFPPKPTDTYVSDQAKILSATDRQFIQSQAIGLLQSVGAPVVVATIPSLAAMDAPNLTVDGYAQRLFSHWGIGSQNRNVGVLLLVSVGDRKARIELGRDWQNRYNDRAHQVMQKEIVPSFRTGDYPGGIRRGVVGIVQMTSFAASDDGSNSGTPAESQSGEISDSANPNTPEADDGSSGISPVLAFIGLVGCSLFVLVFIAFAAVRNRISTITGGRVGGPFYGMPSDDPNLFIVNNMVDTTPNYTSGPADSGGFDAGSSGGGGFDGGSGGGGGDSGSW